MTQHLTYKSSGVSLAANEQMVRRIRRYLKSTQDGRVLGDELGFAGCFKLQRGRRPYRDPVLVACSDGVGSKVLLAGQARRFDTVGVDLVAMNVNDLLTSGAEPLFFLDYIALDKNRPARTAAIVRGIATGCREARCTLLGGETAEMPDLYRAGHFDLAGFAVGVAERRRLITGRRIHRGDVLIGLASSGLHSNGFALIRKLLLEKHGYKLSRRIRGLRGSLGNELLKPTRIYVRPLLSLLRKEPSVITGVAHITGGGLPGNVPRMLPPGRRAVVEKGSWTVPPIFNITQSLGVSEKEMYRVFNMGVGMVIALRAKHRDAAIRHFKRHGVPAGVIGHIVDGKPGVEFTKTV